MNEFEEEKSSNEVWPEGHLTELFRILEPLCLKYVIATHLLPELPFLRQYAGKITKTERKSPPEATKLLFDLIKDSDEPGKWKKFTLALKETEFLSLYKVCSVCEKDDFDFYIDLFELLSMDFACHDVDIMNLSKGMLQSESLTKKQFEQIIVVLQEEGEVAAILEFLSCLPSSLEIWLQALQSCLFAVNREDLCKLIQKKGVEIDVFKKIDLEHFVKLYYNRICERVRPQDIKIYLEPHNLIPSMNLNSLSPSEEMSKILENIERSEIAGKWRTFLNALKHAGYESLHKMLTNEGKDIDDSEQTNLLKNVAPEITKSIDINIELLSKIKEDGLINERCYQEITKKKQDSGDIAAVEMLLENIHRFKDGWFESFLWILREVGQENVVKKIDPDFQYFLECGKVIEKEVEEVEGNNDTMRTVLPDPTMELSLTINGEKLSMEVSLRKNCIIYIFKERNALALEIIKMNLVVDEKFKVVFLGKPRSLELQEHLLRTDDTKFQVSNFSNNGCGSLENVLLRNQVVLLTPDALKNSNLEKLFSHFSLLIIDECFLTEKNHPYNELMKHYIDHKLDNSSIPLPQVIGLTSFSHGKPKNDDQARDLIKLMCANLDCEELCTLQDDGYFAWQSKFISSNRSDCKNPFKEKVEEIMCKIENHFKDSAVLEVIKKEKSKLLETVNLNINKHDRSSYTSWLAELRRDISELTDNNIHSHCICCCWFLNMFHNALEISTFCEIEHAYDYIQDALSDYKDDSEIYGTLYAYWHDERQYIQNEMLSKEPKYSNHQLAILKSTIEDEIKNNSWSRIVVFVQTPILANVLLNWMMDFEELRSLLPSKVEKSRVYQERVYKDMIETFDRKECQLCVAILRDRMKMQQTYNLRLDYFDESFDDKGTQMKGSDSSGGNYNPESFLHKAMIQWKKLACEDSEGYQDKIKRIQRDAKSKRIKKGDSNHHHSLKNREFEILCKYCQKFVCYSFEIRSFKGDRFFVCNPNFLQVHAGNKMDSGSTIECLQCYSVWGNIWKEDFLLPVLKISSFLIVDISKRVVNVDKWQSVPFYRMIQEATKEELKKMIAE